MKARDEFGRQGEQVVRDPPVLSLAQQRQEQDGLVRRGAAARALGAMEASKGVEVVAEGFCHRRATATPRAIADGPHDISEGAQYPYP